MDAPSHPRAGTDDSLAEVIRLLRLAQTGHREQALALADEHLRVAETPGMLYVRAAALIAMGDPEGAARTAERILPLTAGDGIHGSPVDQALVNGWRSIALSFRAWARLRFSESDRRAFDLESILHDLTQAEALLPEDVPDGFVMASARTCLGNGYSELRLFEFARPQYELAFAAATAAPDVIVERAVASQVNLTTIHLNWSMELLRIGDTVGAQEKSDIAARHAALAQKYATTDETLPYAAHIALMLACAESGSGDPLMSADRIRAELNGLEGGARESRAFALPFLARALDQAGQHTEAQEVAKQAISALPDNASWVTAAPAYHTLATLLARSGSDWARAALAYGDQLAEELWRQRLRTLHNARSMQVLERVTLERDQVQVLANTDALTGVGNRRAFDVRMANLAMARADAPDVAMIVVDVDALKAINDAGGHEAGDRTLKGVAGALISQVRPGDLVARLGGDEFAAVLQGLDRAAAEEVAQGMVDAVSAALGSTVTVSVGVATGPASEAGSSLLRAADRAMYAAKRNRRILMTGKQPVVADQN
ncbi:MAG: diguanylate cyclase domain-containing protein [Geodermatophilaceae bacterium]